MDAHVIMPAMHLRASTKFIKLGYVLCLMLALAIAVYLEASPKDPRWWWALIVPGLLMIVVLTRHIERRLMKLEILGDRLRFESGFLSKTTRTMELVKVQDVRVDQTLGQRMIGVGDLSFETAGETSRIVMRSIDRPQLAADHILELAKAQRLRPDAGPAASHSTP
jgi:membrane protein YdbS with pleckstrin-like domain